MKEITASKVILLILFMVFVAIMSLILVNHDDRETEALLSRADYLIARSEASIERWNHGR